MNNTKQKVALKRWHSILMVVMILFFGVGFIFQELYNKSPENALDMEQFQETFTLKTDDADKKMDEIVGMLSRGNIDSVVWVSFEKLPAIYLVYENDALIFWSSNQTEPEHIHSEAWSYRKLSNVHAAVKSRKVDVFEVVSYVPIKYNFPYENVELQNVFTKGFKLDKRIELAFNLPADKNAVFNKSGAYLFTLQLPEHKIYNERLSIVAMLFLLAGFLLLFYFYARFPALLGKTHISYRDFFIIGSSMALLVFVLMMFDIPNTFFQNKTFTPFQYASNTILTTLTHLSFLTVYLFATILLFCYYVKNDIDKEEKYLVKKYFILTVDAIYFFLIFIFLKGVVFNSVTELNMLKLNVITFPTIWNHILFLIWGISFMLLHLKTHNMLIRIEGVKGVLIGDIIVGVLSSIFVFFYVNKYSFIAIISYFVLYAILYLPHFFPVLKRTQWYLAIWLFPFSIFVTWSSIYMNKEKRFEKYKIIAENHFLNENTEEGRIAESLIYELNNRIGHDQYIKEMVRYPDSLKLANEYINEIYLRGFWNKYEVRLFASKTNAQLDLDYKNAILIWGNRIINTNFYSITNPNSEMKFLGKFTSTKNGEPNVNYYLEFYSKNNYKSFSYPNLLMENPPSIQTQLALSSARYQSRKLIYSSGEYKYLPKADWIERNSLDYFTQKENGYIHYIYVPNVYNYYVLSEQYYDGFFTYLLYLLYTFTIYLCLVFFAIWLTKIITKKNKSNFTSKFMYSFTILLLASLIAIFYLSINYIENSYEKQQQKTLVQTKNYIQSALQDKYYWSEYLTPDMSEYITFDLQDLSYTYQTDIHVYDNNGKLIGTSQPSLFLRGISSTQISPIPFFSHNENMNKYEKIGKLEFLTAYTDFYNGDFLQIGYIAIPQYLSSNKLQQDLQNFLVVIVHIYLLIIFTFVVLSLIISNQLTAPLKMLGEKLIQIRLGKENRKIKYSQKDEIGLLVEQYNNMVDKLKRSADLLAESERESAWKIMARQVAHEIKNPLTPMKLTIQQIQRRKKMNDSGFDEYFDSASETLIEQIENLSRIANAFSSVAKLPDIELTRIDVAKKILSVIKLFENNTKNVTIEYSGAETEYFTFADREKIIQVFNNLIKNAIQAIPSNREGLIEINIETADNKIFITVKDNGRGMTSEVKEKLFMPNFTTKSTGMGLGLYISKNVVEAFGGKITFTSEQNIGTEFIVELPMIN